MARPSVKTGAKTRARKVRRAVRGPAKRREPRRAGRFGLIFAQLNLPPEYEEEFNDWYDLEHIPQRLTLPGWRTARRGERASAPRYIALYDLDTLDVLAHRLYKLSSGEHRTPWTARMMRKSRTFTRQLYAQLVPGREAVRADHPYTVMRFVPFEASAREVTVALLTEQVNEVRRRGDATARLYEGNEKAAGTLLVLYTAAEAGAARALAEQARQAERGGRVEEYGPYVRAPEDDRNRG